MSNKNVPAAGYLRHSYGYGPKYDDSHSPTKSNLGIFGIWGAKKFDPYPVLLKKAESRPCSMSESVRTGTTLPRPLDGCHQRQLQLLQPGALAAIQAQTNSLSPPKSVSPRLQNSSSNRISNHVPQPSHCLNHRQSRMCIYTTTHLFHSFHVIPFHFIPFHSVSFRSFRSISFHSISWHFVRFIPFHFFRFHLILFHSTPLKSSYFISCHLIPFMH